MAPVVERALRGGAVNLWAHARVWQARQPLWTGGGVTRYRCSLVQLLPSRYQEFIKTQAQVAKEEAEKARDPHVESLAPALVLEAQAQQPQAAAVVAAAAAAGGAPASVANLVGGSKAVARVHVWAATDGERCVDAGLDLRRWIPANAYAAVNTRAVLHQGD